MARAAENKDFIPKQFTDLTFIVGPEGQTQSISVIKNYLRASSAPFDRMLSGQWAENDQSEVRLPDDNPDAFRLLLEILYRKKNTLSAAPPRAQLLALTSLCDKYDLAASVRDCALAWTTSRTQVLGFDCGRCVSAEERLWIAWVFGDRASFETALHQLISTVSEGSNSQLRCHHLLLPSTSPAVTYRNLNVSLLCGGTENMIRNAVAERIKAMKVALQEFVRHRISGGPAIESLCILTSNKELCGIANIGGLMKRLSILKIPLFREPELVVLRFGGSSVEQTAHKLRAPLLYPTIPAHEHCIPTKAWNDCIEKVLKQKPLLTTAQIKHLTRFDERRGASRTN